jgi:ribosomal protein L35
MKSISLPMVKIRKSFLKRFSLTKKGKILRRVSGQSHSFAKRESESLLRKKKIKETSKIVLDYKNY